MSKKQLEQLEQLADDFMDWTNLPETTMVDLGAWLAAAGWNPKAWPKKAEQRKAARTAKGS
ncbi:MAG: hypothetical protein KA354_22910 [Phycisphaerae bacterium]|nr:hypothetical protein [Phycisphaerae bacterium]